MKFKIKEGAKAHVGGVLDLSYTATLATSYNADGSISFTAAFSDNVEYRGDVWAVWVKEEGGVMSAKLENYRTKGTVNLPLVELI